ncbi:MAG TPA: TIGR03915 family putative DNA repair protein [Chitinophaga sp.]|uniref:TIGR03915 family putative DNA repair protein n=1 Tax=Chitinophaga sp. TaxID=1869181 RepID=UPI002DBE8915|nr:TIGR03915 family putative DNA repair protein [Chitinophaga sp.]HEU4555320.1 TIGR03915 family putative DNA repair protein [Chitinophaga sp.]
MQTVVYDRSFEGFFTAVFEIYEYKIKDPDIRPEGAAPVSLFARPHTVHTSSAKAMRVINKLQAQLPEDGLANICRVLLSGQPGAENRLFRYIQYALQAGKNMATDYSHPDVLWLQQLVHKVGREKHRMEAFIRFQKTKDGLFYAVVEPDFNVLPLVSRHFEDRYADQHWLIYDARRKYGLYYNLQCVSEVTIDFAAALNDKASLHTLHDEQEDLYQSLWKTYFGSTNIAARKNMKLHVQHMPRRYWKNLVEKLPG